MSLGQTPRRGKAQTEAQGRHWARARVSANCRRAPPASEYIYETDLSPFQ